MMHPVTRRVTAQAYAKINWGLEIPARRPDGYHEIVTLTHTISLHDSLDLALAGDADRVTVTGDWEAPEGPENSCLQAVKAFRAAFRAPTAGVQVALYKRIPPGGGLGGGSSDCIAVLAALADLGQVETGDRLHDVAASLGSDTALFLHGGAALCTGRGEVVAPLPCPRRYDLVVARPACAVSTAHAYSLLDGADFSDGTRVRDLAALVQAGAAPEALAQGLVNTFQEKVMAQYPGVAALREALLEAGAVGAAMTGSGSAVYGITTDAAQAQALCAALRAGGVWARAVHTTDRGYLLTEEPQNA